MKKIISFIYYWAILFALLYSAGYMLNDGNIVFGVIVLAVAILHFLVFIGVKKIKHFF